MLVKNLPVGIQAPTSAALKEIYKEHQQRQIFFE
jgi:hypothetical protein